MSEVAKLQAVKRSLAIAQRVTGNALTEAKKHRSVSPKSLAGGRRRRSSKGAAKVGKKGSKKGSRKGRRHSRKGKK